MDHRTHGQLAQLWMNAILHNQVLHSAAGYYIGTKSKDGVPFTRESAEYYPTEEDAQNALETDTWTQRLVP